MHFTTSLTLTEDDPIYITMLNFYREVMVFHQQVVNENSLASLADTKCYPSNDLTVIDFRTNLTSLIPLTSLKVSRARTILVRTTLITLLPKRIITSSPTTPQMYYTPVSNRCENLCK
ncbi:hypothetical protein TNCT_378821 [Trichonephila clavata]|uniref:Uncharacterized protein n=1 Tax=Trichonephila clavata TaxID=2740835 RepID=A0A8X6LXI7_TRICU|nr:hypothetical protein TNCT_378821 [Trichonephila clavata]